MSTLWNDNKVCPYCSLVDGKYVCMYHDPKNKSKIDSSIKCNELNCPILNPLFKKTDENIV